MIWESLTLSNVEFSPKIKILMIISNKLKGKNFLSFPHHQGKNVVFSPNRKGDNKILTPKEENSVPRGEAARDRILLPAG